MSEESWTAELAVEVDDLRGGSGTLRITCRFHGAVEARAAVEKRVASKLGGICGFAASKYGMLPEYFVGRESTLTDQLRASLARSDDGPPTLRCEVLEVQLEEG